MNVQSNLRDLDKHASEFNFPVLDNAYVELAATRLTVFQRLEERVIAFEVVGFSNRQGIFSNDLYGFGTCLKQAGFISSSPVLEEPPSLPLIDHESGESLADWKGWSAVVRGRAFMFAPTQDEYAVAGIVVPDESGPGSLKEGQVMRYFIAREGADKLFLQQDELKAELQLDTRMSVFLQTYKWQHPDVAGGEKPSENVSIRSLLTALYANSPAAFQKGCPNTDWKNWQSTARFD